MKIYTRKGDQGETGLIGGERRAKCDAIFEALGTLDELNASIGSAICACQPETITRLDPVQNQIFSLGAIIASPGPDPDELESIEAWILQLEQDMDRMDSDLPPLKNFILPGGSEGSARIHLVRTICRRAERRIAELSTHQPVDTKLQAYVNRLSDWLFVLARHENFLMGECDRIWKNK